MLGEAIAVICEDLVDGEWMTRLRNPQNNIFEVAFEILIKLLERIL